MSELQHEVHFCTGKPSENHKLAMRGCRVNGIAEHRRNYNQRHYMTFLFTALCCLGVLLWNVKLQQEIRIIQNDLNYLKHVVESSYSLRNEIRNEHQQAEAIDLSPVETYEVDSNLRKNILHKHVRRSAELSSDADENIKQKDTTLVRNRRSRKKYGISKKAIRKALKRNKAIGIHVRAGTDGGQPLTSRETGADIINKTIGRALTTWQTPDSGHYFGFDTSNLRTTGKIKVPTNGMYFVYSQVVFATREGSYSISEIKAGYEGGNIFVQCQYHGRETSVDPRLTCNSNGLVYLQKNDEISIRVHPTDLQVLLEPEYTYFGAFLVGL